MARPRSSREPGSLRLTFVRPPPLGARERNNSAVFSRHPYHGELADGKARGNGQTDPGGPERAGTY